MNSLGLQEKIKFVREHSGDLALRHLSKELDELEGKLATNQFNLVITGLFKRGKSSVINALIGQQMAPVGVTPVTAAITLFEHAESTRCEVVFNDNQTAPIALNEISQYVSEEENPGNAKQVSLIKVYTNHSELLKTCSIVDTPGLGSVFEHNTETTYHYISRIDAAIFVLSTDSPISKTDAEFLTNLKTRVPKIIYVINKTDLLEKEKLEKLTAFNRKVIAETVEQEEDTIEIIPISCKLAGLNSEEGNIGMLADVIKRMIENNKDEILLQTGSKRLNDIIAEILQLLKIQLEAIKMPLKEIEQKQESLRRSMELMTETRHEFDILVKGQLDMIVTGKLVKAESMLKDLTSELNKQIDRSLDELTFKNESLRAASEGLSEACVERLNHIKLITEQQIVEEFNQLITRHQSRSESFLNEFSRMLAELFGLSMDSVSSRFNLDVYSSFYFLKYVDGQSIAPKLPSFYRFLPISLKRSKVKSILKFNIETLIEVNKGRMKSDIFYKTNESFRIFNAEEELQAQRVYSRIHDLLEETIALKLKDDQSTELVIGEIDRRIALMKNTLAN
ncbi:MAG: dynamin family protein [Bacteroidia bacterium]|nr:dynamin family protein [Bacteroidia bacterium]